jgi:hypothetical protein
MDTFDTVFDRWSVRKKMSPAARSGWRDEVARPNVSPGWHFNVWRLVISAHLVDIWSRLGQAYWHES